MADLEKVKTGLECCAIGAECDHCPYSQMNEGKGDYTGCHQLHWDALELLKEKQPRLMALAEVEKSKGKDVFVEVRYVPSENCDFPAYHAVFASTIDKEQPTYDHIWFYKHINEKEQYGKRWRCWTARPTEEQCKAEPWEDGEQDAVN